MAVAIHLGPEKQVYKGFLPGNICPAMKQDTGTMKVPTLFWRLCGFLLHDDLIREVFMNQNILQRKTLIKLILSGLFIALGMVLPFFTGQIPQIGSMMLHMHIPVLICGFVCGWPYGLVVGLITPVFRSLILGMPPMFPTAVAMAFELAAYGCMTGLFYKLLPKKPVYVYVTLILSMVIGRVVWGLVSFALLGLSGKAFTFQLFLGGAFINAVPGIIVQIILIPILILALQKANLMKYAD